MDDWPPEVWDANLARLGGHPLQSAMWGLARAKQGTREFRIALVSANNVHWMGRVEVRSVPVLGLVGWVPKGPTSLTGFDPSWQPDEVLRGYLRKRGIHLLVTDPYARDDLVPEDVSRSPATIWIDLTIGREAVFAGLDKKWRNGVRRAAKEGVFVSQSSAPEDVATFVELCSEISSRKGFQLNVSRDIAAELLAQGTVSSRACLFVARRQGAFLSAALIMVVGQHWHYFWGGTNRSVGDFRAGEAVQWAVIEAAIAASATSL